jgi:hypothetical protein
MSLRSRIFIIATQRSLRSPTGMLSPGDATRGPLGNIFGALIKRVRFAADSPLEAEFEPPVPIAEGDASQVCSGLAGGLVAFGPDG